jgi:hypothetical protein
MRLGLSTEVLELAARSALALVLVLWCCWCAVRCACVLCVRACGAAFCVLCCSSWWLTRKPTPG